MILGAQIEIQESRNNLLKAEIGKLDEQIKEIDKLREQTQALLARKQVVETLQSTRTKPYACSTRWCASCRTAST